MAERDEKARRREKKEKPDLYLYERELHTEGLTLICGVDEAGRGPLAGPVAAAAVLLPPALELPGLNDSKKLSPKKREELYELITAQAEWSVALASVAEIEDLNILNASFLAMRRAVDGLPRRPELALIDGNMARGMTVAYRCVVGGDARVAAIAAASIIAKVTRDRLMTELAAQYPQYAFERHKGYGTALHYERLREYGPSPVHRLSFLKNMK